MDERGNEALLAYLRKEQRKKGMDDKNLSELTERTAMALKEALAEGNEEKIKKFKNDLFLAIGRLLEYYSDKFYRMNQKRFADKITSEDILSEAWLKVSGYLLETWDPSKNVPFSKYVGQYLYLLLQEKYRRFFIKEAKIESLERPVGGSLEDDSDLTFLDLLPDASAVDPEEEAVVDEKIGRIESGLNDFFLKEPLTVAIFIIRNQTGGGFSRWLERNRELWNKAKIEVDQQKAGQLSALDVTFGDRRDEKEITLEEISKALGITRERVRQIEDKAKKFLNANLAESKQADETSAVPAEEILKEKYTLNQALLVILKYGIGAGWGNKEWAGISSKKLLEIRQWEKKKMIEIIKRIRNGKIPFQKRTDSEVGEIIGCSRQTVNTMLRSLGDVLRD